MVMLVSKWGRNGGLSSAGIGDSGGSGGPVSIVLQLQGQKLVEDPWGLVFPTEQPGQAGRGPAVIGHLRKYTFSVNVGHRKS